MKRYELYLQEGVKVTDKPRYEASDYEIDLFEGRALYQHQNDVFGDITERDRKIAEMTHSERDRFWQFNSEKQIIQIRHEVLTPEMNEPMTWVDQLGCTLAQAERIVQCLMVIEPDGSKVKREIMERVANTLIDDQAKDFVQIEMCIAYLTDIADALDDVETPYEDALNHHVPYSRMDLVTGDDHTYDDYSEWISAEDEVVDDPFQNDPISAPSEFVYRSVYDEGYQRPYLSDKEFNRLCETVKECTDLEQLKQIGSWLFENQAMTYEQSQQFWGKDLTFKTNGSKAKAYMKYRLYNAKKYALEQKSKKSEPEVLVQLKEDLGRASTMGNIKYIGAWLFHQLNGMVWNKKPADQRFSKLDSIQVSKMWDAYNNAKAQFAMA
jgi:hypothetical protein